MRKRIRRAIGYRLDRLARWCLRDVPVNVTYTTATNGAADFRVYWQNPPTTYGGSGNVCRY